MRFVRALVYRLGFRPRFGSIFHSPTRHLLVVTKDWPEKFREGLEKMERDL